MIQEEAPNSNGLGPHYYDTKLYFTLCLKRFLIEGFCKKRCHERSTADRAAEYMMLDTEISEEMPSTPKSCEEKWNLLYFSPESSSIDKTVEEAYTWLAQQEETDNYMHNLITACKLEYTHIQKLWNSCHLFPTYNRSVEKKKLFCRSKKAQQEPYRNSEWIGKYHCFLFLCLTSWENDYGYTYIYRITDDKNNVYTLENK